MLKLIFSSLFILLCVILPAQDSYKRLDSLFTTLYSYRQFNGTVLVAEKGNIIFRKSLGFANQSRQLANRDSSVFALGSVSKILTSTAILQLKEKGKIRLDDALIKYFPGFPYPAITIRHLLTHTSGLPDYDLYEEEMDKNPRKIFTIADIIPSLKNWKQPLHFEPGEKWQYSNTNFCLLALLLEKVTGKSFPQYVQQFIFKPAKMTHTYFQTDTIQSMNKNQVVNYEYPWLFSMAMQPVDSIKRNYWRLYNASGFLGQGNIMTTADDMLQFDETFFAGQLVKPATIKEILTPAKLNSGDNVNAGTGIGKTSYGLGWFIADDTTKGRLVGHTGGVPGGLSIYLRNMDRKQTVIAFDNTFGKTLYTTGVNIMHILNGQPVIKRPVSFIQDYAIELQKNGPDIAFCKLVEWKSDTLHYFLSENDMNELGLQLLYAASFEQHSTMALEVLRLNILLFPDGFNTYDSYAEALAFTGKKKEAIAMYKKSIQLNPNNNGGKKALEKLLNE